MASTASVSKLNNAVRSGKIEKVERLLDNELKGEEDIINQVSDRGQGVSPLMVACQQDESRDMIKLLLRRGAKVNLQNLYGWTALMKAVNEGYEDNARCLIEMKKEYEYDVQWELQNSDDGTVLMIACRHSYTQLVELLVANGAEVNVVGIYSNMSPLAIAIEHKHLDMIIFLLDKGAKVTYDIISDLSHPAKNYFRTELLKVLLDRGIDVSGMLTSSGESLLLIYTTSGEAELVKLCLEKGHNVDALDNNGKYPLWHAVERENYGIFELLWNKGANPRMRPNDNKSALDMLRENSSLMTELLWRAVENKNSKLIKFLQENGAKFDKQEDIAALLVSV